MTGFARDEISFVVETRTKMMALLSAISHLRFCESLQLPRRIVQVLALLCGRRKRLLHANKCFFRFFDASRCFHSGLRASSRMDSTEDTTSFSRREGLRLRILNAAFTHSALRTCRHDVAEVFERGPNPEIGRSFTRARVVVAPSRTKKERYLLGKCFMLRLHEAVPRSRKRHSGA
jgi:hypothetical protein